nr:PREDICTED: protein SRG1-like [Daucus carota subsp. sativus]
MENHGDHFHEAQYTDQNGVLQTTKIPVVQELARKGITNLPQRFITSPQTLSATTQVEVPTIDLLKLRVESDSSRYRELAKLAGAAKEWGMFLVANHGVHDSVLDSVKDVVMGFFGLSFEEKKKSVGSFMSVDNMGYGRNFVRSENQPLDWIDRMTMVASPVDDENLRVWPKKPHNFREVMVKYAEETQVIFSDLLQAMAEALSLDKNAFLQQFEPKRSELKIRTNYYPS